MPTAVDLAQVIYNKLGRVDAWKLEKLTYYCQAWSLGWYGRPLVSNEFQACNDGPVEPNLYRANKYQRLETTSTVLPGASPEAIGDEAEKIIDAVISFYGVKTSRELVELTHSERPWIAARGQIGAEDKTNEPISQLEMKKFYALQEARGADGPTRPMLSVQHFSDSDLQQRLQASAERWKGALEILATR